MEAIRDQALEGGWRSLCAAMLVQAVYRITGRRGRNALTSRSISTKSDMAKELAMQKSQARAWIKGGEGQITFEDACASAGLDPDRVRSALEDFVSRAESRVA